MDRERNSRLAGNRIDVVRALFLATSLVTQFNVRSGARTTASDQMLGPGGRGCFDPAISAL